ncbi:hypothetical protein [Aliiruegeria sabulilitoris]|uniref:hypothetical protein n=1 Tax=Aliiruegeria sabulilitoris TaxID=1510458 RepID=UPI000833C0C9|nr:hypothetical protein [Aliiruegeria sabulilitoris]NDR56011.1 hypothetical protein [Pseudoruegeria sp. M32A2M]
MHVTLHLGAHRTGASTMQNFLTSNARLLAQEGIAVWAPPQTRRGMLSGLVRRPDRITLPLERLGRHSCGRLQVLQHSAARAGMERLILSEQNLLGTVAECLRSERLYPWVFERLNRVVPALHGSCDRIVLGIRAYDRFWTSLLGQAVLNGHSAPDRAVLDRLVTQPRRWRRVIEEISAAFPSARLFVWPYERLGGLPERQLAAMTGNSLSPGFAVRMAGVRSWEARAPTPEDICEVMADCGHLAPIPISSDGRWLPFDLDQREALVAQYAEDVAWLRSGANGHATLIERADARELRIMDMTGGSIPDDRHQNTTGLG